MRAGRAELTVGLVPQGGAFWIAGVLYLENIVRAALSLDAGRPEFCFIADAEHPLDSGSGLTLDVPVYFYTHRSHDRWSHAARNSVLSGRLPRSLETLASRLNLSVLFPLQIPPGERLPVPWIGWIPDFQHKRQPQFFSDVERAVRDSRFRRFVDEASHVIVSSQDAHADLMRWFPTTDARVSVFHFRTMLDPRWFGLSPRAVADRLDLPLKYLTYPSQLWVHKNHRTVLAALSLLRARGRTDVVLVCTGREHDFRCPEYALASVMVSGVRAKSTSSRKVPPSSHSGTISSLRPFRGRRWPTRVMSI
jgi:hypothetical protein